MGEWIKYDGTNKPDDDVQVRVAFEFFGWEEAESFEPACMWDWGYREHGYPGMITRFIIKK